MELDEWWSRLSVRAQDWLTANNGDVVPDWVLTEIVAAGGDVSSDAGWVGESDADGWHLSDSAIDWIEATANDED
ncbi:hypothetical protein [Cryobacterium sp. SO1]|uniref:hypothetical protein n=1 Tax=Cryobacterium sp. SO1 TaxID=1897061 RepID=UPI001022A4B5|nr:hypothetical protein [Cryobacterium sp. SO1]RZI34711.1 hypothetical protein BJQ95_02765 [Cryobacterium sp. SO1]